MSDEFANLIRQEYKRIKLVGPAKDSDRIVAQYKSLGWEHVLTGPAPIFGGGVDARQSVMIFEREDAKPGTVVGEEEKQ